MKKVYLLFALIGLCSTVYAQSDTTVYSNYSDYCKAFSLNFLPVVPHTSLAYLYVNGCAGAVIWRLEKPDGLLLHMGSDYIYKFNETTTFHLTCYGKDSCQNFLTATVRVPPSTFSNPTISTTLSYEDILNNLKNVVPPSPNSSAFAKYGEIPVSLDRGVASIDVPITNIGIKGFSLPIGLSFHTAGNKVGEAASSVGLGANLNFGGGIFRSVRQLPDETQSAGYFAIRQKYPNLNALNVHTGMDSSAWQSDIVNSTKLTADVEQDIYSIILMGKTYHLLFKGDNSIVTIPYSDLKITTNFTDITVNQPAQTWTVISEDGIKYTFGGGNNANELNNNVRFDPNSYVSAWYLKTIMLPTGESINFTYTTATIKQDAYFGENDFIQIGTGFTHGTINTKVEKQTIYSPHISTIESDLMRIEFVNNSGRQDLEGGLSLDQINVYSKLLSSYTEKYTFNYEYSTATNSVEYNPLSETYFGKRLRLLAFNKLSLTGGTPQTWGFSYYPINLPSRRSYAQDHFGYYNGATTNNTLLPPLSYPFSNPNVNFFPPLHNLGANRESDGDAMKAEVLTKITYPTKGYTQFNYEPNSIDVTKETFRNSSISLNLLASQSSVTTQMLTFSNTKLQNISIGGVFNFSTAYLNDFGNATQLVKLYITAPSGTVTSLYVITKNILGTNTSYNFFKYVTISEIGTYTFTLYSIGGAAASTDYTLYANLSYDESLGNHAPTQLLGGLRIASIINYDIDGSSNTNKKQFVYENPFVISPVELDSYVNTVNTQNSNNTFDTKVVRNSTTRFSLGSIQGGTVGYGKVTTYNYGNSVGDNGKTVSEFTTFPDDDSGVASIFPYPPTDSRDFERGLLLTQTDYGRNGSSFIPFRKIANTYAFVQKLTYSNFKSGYLTMYNTCPASTTTTVAGYCGLNTSYYNNTTFQVKHTSTTESMYDLAGNLVNDKLTNLYYDSPNHTQQTRSETFDSDNTKTTVLTNFPKDYASGSGFIDNLVANNMFFPVETVKFKENSDGSNTQVLGGAILKYQANAYGLKDNLLVLDISDPLALSTFKFSNATIGNKPLSSGFTTFNPDSRYISRLVYDNYDTHKNLVSYHTKSYLDNLPTSFLWAYQGYNPIAEIKNANWANTTAGLSAIGTNEAGVYALTNATTIQNNMQSLRTNLAGSYLSSYAYTSFYGLASLVSPNDLTSAFSYDDFIRLKTIKDHNGNLTDFFQYKYATSTGTLAPPTISISSTSLCSATLTASGCAGTLNWSSGGAATSINVPTNTNNTYTATCTVGSVTSSNSNSLTIPTLPTSWSSGDVGSPPTAGCTQYTAGSLTFSGNGYDFNSGNGNTTDAFHYVYETSSGDVTIIAKLSSLIATTDKRAGIMFRSSTNNNAQYFSIIQDGNGAVATLRRTSDGVARDFLNYVLNQPINTTWLKIVKTSNSFSAFYSTNGSTWTTLITGVSVSLPSNFLMGFVVYDDGHTTTNQATFDNITINGESF